MTGYSLSKEAQAAQAKWNRSLETKSVVYPVSALSPGAQDGLNFRSNLTTVSNESIADRRENNPLGIAATWACVNLLAGTIASLPLMVYRTDRSGVRTIARNNPLYYVLHDSPNFDQTAVDFWEYMCAGIELHGNAYAEIGKRADGSLYDLRPIRPDLVMVERKKNGELGYRWTDERGPHNRTQTEILHIRGFGGGPLGGASTLNACARTFSSAGSAEIAAASMFTNGAMPSGVLSTDKTLTPEQRQLAEQLLTEKFRGAMNAGRPMLLDNAVKWEQLTLSPEDTQLLESRRFGIEEICRVFGVPPHMIGHTENSTSWGTGLEQQTLGFQKFTLRRRMKRIEQALEKQLLTPRDRAEGITIEFNLEGLLRGDSASRAAFYESGLQNGWQTINEVRALENLPPVAGGDTPRMQMQNVPITQAGQENGNAA